MAGLTFYCGTAIMLLAVMIWGVTQFSENFNSAFSYIYFPSFLLSLFLLSHA
jgi:hypothetical protein